MMKLNYFTMQLIYLEVSLTSCLSLISLTIFLGSLPDKQASVIFDVQNSTQESFSVQK